VLRDGDEVKLGALYSSPISLRAYQGMHTWTMKVKEANRTYNVVIIGSPNVNPGYQLVNNV